MNSEMNKRSWFWPIAGVIAAVILIALFVPGGHEILRLLFFLLKLF
jgi:hypothetical protein